MRKSFTVSMIAFIFQRLGAEEEVRQGTGRCSCEPFFQLRRNRLHRRDQPCRRQIQVHPEQVFT
jgi:hypothetical protein